MAERRIDLRRRIQQPSVQKATPGKSRLNILLDTKLKKWATRYAKKSKAKNITGLLKNYLELLRQNSGGEYIMLFLDRDLRSWLEGYAVKHRTTATQVLVDQVVKMKRRESDIGVEQI